ncbi:hypothetical protein AMS68_007047 [Peltaster fructicola]|uniref:Uncharacterized protein n=1 Tax=Peltaster fructicola TaxID=286661 RepID=A0A6H0Y4J3_9PEZI|nr:hypothetical protein AMS68_007047 [Peltaster fructicola]
MQSFRHGHALTDVSEYETKSRLISLNIPCGVENIAVGMHPVQALVRLQRRSGDNAVQAVLRPIPKIEF